MKTIFRRIGYTLLAIILTIEYLTVSMLVPLLVTLLLVTPILLMWVVGAVASYTAGVIYRRKDGTLRQTEREGRSQTKSL